MPNLQNLKKEKEGKDERNWKTMENFLKMCKNVEILGLKTEILNQIILYLGTPAYLQRRLIKSAYMKYTLSVCI